MNKHWFFLCHLIIIMMCLVSCKKNRTYHIVDNLYNKEITISKELIPISGSEFNNMYSDPEASLLFWFDSTECSICKFERMSLFEDIFIFCRDSVEEHKINVLVLFSPSSFQIDDFFEVLNNTKSKYPLLFDKSNRFSLDNNFLPHSRTYHTFLLDKDNKIILVGSPIVNERIWILYKSTLKELLVN